MKTGTIRGTYGSGKNQCDIFTYEERGGTWYAVDGSTVANFTHQELSEGVNVEELADSDTLTWNEPIRSEEDLETAVEDSGTIPDDEEDLEDARKEYTYTTEAEITAAWNELMETEGHRFVTVLPDGSTHTDSAAQDEAFNNYVDGLQKDGDIPPNYGYSGYDEEDPTTWG